MKEAHLIKNLKHPHIPVIYDIEQNIGEDNDSICKNEKIISMQIPDIRLLNRDRACLMWIIRERNAEITGNVIYN